MTQMAALFDNYIANNFILWGDFLLYLRGIFTSWRRAMQFAENRVGVRLTARSFCVRCTVFRSCLLVLQCLGHHLYLRVERFWIRIFSPPTTVTLLTRILHIHTHTHVFSHKEAHYSLPVSLPHTRSGIYKKKQHKCIQEQNTTSKSFLLLYER